MLVLLIPLLTLTSLCLCAQQRFQLSPDPSHNHRRILSDDIDTFIEELISSWNSPAGISVAVVQQDPDETWHVETKGYGIAKSDGTKMSEDSLMCIASNSKLFTVLSTGLLISNESLDVNWNSRIASLVPEWGLMDTFAEKEATIVDAMSHRTGLPRHDLMYGRADTTSTILSRLRHLRPSAPFRDTWQYNNNMYLLLSYLPTLLLQQHPPFARYVKDNVLTPLGLASTTYSIDVARESGNLADGFAREKTEADGVFEQGKARAMYYPNAFLDGGEDGNYKSGAGGVIMNAKDAATWLQVLLLEGKNPQTGEQVIPAEVIRKVASGITVETGTSVYPELSPIVYGGGQFRGSYRGHEYIEHGGSTSGFKTQIIRFPSQKFGIAVFSNDDAFGGAFHNIVKWRIADEWFGLDIVDWEGRTRSLIQESHDQYKDAALPRPLNASLPPAVTFESLSGWYKNPGYGEFEFCYIPPRSTIQSPANVNTSESCRTLLAEHDTLLPGAVDPHVPTLLALWDRAWSTHLMLEHWDGLRFNLTALESRETIGDPDQAYWAASFLEQEIITAEFAYQEDAVVGFSITSGFWGAGNGVQGPCSDGSAIVRGWEAVRDCAEVWFEKVH